MEDKLIMSNVLSFSKGLIEVLIHAVIESSTDNVHQVLKKQLVDNLALQNEIFKFMEQEGWYTLKNAPKQKIEISRDKFNCN
jgi:spore coat protein CotF